MVTSTLDLRLPQAPPTDTPVVKPPRLNLSVQGDGSSVLNGVVLSEHALQSALADVARGAPTTIVAITTSDEADYQAFTGALAAARNGGISNVAVER